MAKPTLTVELEVDPNSNLQPFFTLDDATLGVLDSPLAILAGLTFFDVSEYVAGVSINRGASRELDRITAGQASVVFNNDTRLFDPENTASPFSDQLLPRRQLRIKANGTAVYLGIVDDWNFNYDLAGNNTSVANCYDKLTLLSRQTLDEFAVAEELPGTRVTNVLDRPEVAWSATERNIEPGENTLAAGTVVAETNSLEYLNLINTSEDGSLYIAKNGYFTFQDGLTGPSSTNSVLFSSENDGVPFTAVSVVYGSELLYNRVITTQQSTGVSVIASDLDSQDLFGISTLNQDNLLLKNLSDSVDLATTLLNRYNEPEYRFESLEVDITELTLLQQTNLLGIELNDTSHIKFQPNNTGVVIDKYAQVIGIKHAIDAKRHKMAFAFRTLDFAPFVLDDAVFGTLGGAIESYDLSSKTYDALIRYDGTDSPTGNRLG